MSIGSKRHQMQLQGRSRVKAAGGRLPESWSLVSKVWANISPIRGWEQFHGMQLESPVSHKIIIRYRSNITTDHRLVFRNRTFSIRAVLDKDEIQRFLTLLTEEGVVS